MKNKIVHTVSHAPIRIALLATALAFAVPGFCAEDNFEWVPAEAHEGKSGGSYQEGLQATPVTFTKIPKATADASKFTKEYLVDLKKFNISSDGKNPAETSKGINQALQDAQATGANRVVFPKGTYLISETDPVAITNKNMIIDLNGSTFQINTNGELTYAIVKFDFGAENVRLTNGTLLGDKDTHDYTTVKGSHEGGCGLRLFSGSNLEVDHLTVSNVPGYGVNSRAGISGPHDPAHGFHIVPVKNLEQGGFSNTGGKEKNEQKTRTIKPYDISLDSFSGGFEFGYNFGYMSYPSVFGRNYQAYLYDKDMKFLKKKDCIQFKKSAIPEGAKFIHLEFNQPEVKEAARHGLCGSILSSRPPMDVHFHHNVISNNRSLGFGFCGGQRWIIEENSFEGNGGISPGYGIDFEDGWDFMQDIVLRNNKFKNNKRGDLVVCAGSEMIFEGNEFEKNVVVYARTHNYTLQKNHFMGDVVLGTRTGIVKLRDNVYENSATISVAFNGKGKKETFNDGIYHKPGEKVTTPPICFENETLTNIGRIVGTYFKFVGCKIKNVKFLVDKSTSLIQLKNCELENCTFKYYDKDGPELEVLIENCKGEIKEEGPGLKRKKSRQ